MLLRPPLQEHSPKHCSPPARSSHLLPTPYALQHSIPLRQSIQRVIALAHGAHKAAQSVYLVFARVPSIFVHFADGDLHRGVVFGFDDAIGGGAFAGNVATADVNGWDTALTGG